MPDACKPTVLSYRTPADDPRESPLDPAWATALALPGVCGFCLLAAALVFRSDLAWAIGPRAGLALWGIALASAIFSFFYFKGRRKSGWMKFCLALNWLGVIFTVTPPGWVVLMLTLMILH